MDARHLDRRNDGYLSKKIDELFDVANEIPAGEFLVIDDLREVLTRCP